MLPNNLKLSLLFTHSLLMTGCFEMDMQTRIDDVVSFQDTVVFADAALQRCFDENVAEQQLQTIAEVNQLNCRGYGISDSRGLAQLTELQQLDMRNNPLSQAEVVQLTEFSQANAISLQRSSMTFDELEQAVSDSRLWNCIEQAITASGGEWHDVSDVTMLECDRQSIQSLQGIDALYHLARLMINNYDTPYRLEDVNLRYNSQLETLALKGTHLTTIDLQYNTALKELDLNNNNLTEIDVSMLKQLQTLDLYLNYLSEIDLSGLNQLQDLDLDNNRLSVLHLADLPALEDVDAESNRLTAASFRHLPLLEDLELSYNQLSEIEFESTALLNDLDLDNNALSRFDSSHLPSLIDLELSYNRLTELVLADDSKIGWLELDGNRLRASDVDLTRLPLLRSLNIEQNNFNGVLDLSQNPALYRLRADHNGITEVILSQQAVFDDVQLANNALTAIDLSAQTQLTTIKLNNNQLTSVVLPESARDIELYHNQLTALSVEGLTDLRVLKADHNQLHTISGIADTQLEELSLAYNALTAFDYAQLPVTEAAQTMLDLRHNQLSQLAVDALPLDNEKSIIDQLLLWGNPITEISLPDVFSEYNRTVFMLDVSLLDDADLADLQEVVHPSKLIVDDIFDFQINDDEFRRCIDDSIKASWFYQYDIKRSLADITHLDCYGYDIAVIDASLALDALTDLIIESPFLSTLDLSAFDQLESLQVEDALLLSRLDVSFLNHLQRLDIDDATSMSEIILPAADSSSLTGIYITDTVIAQFDSAYFRREGIDIRIFGNYFEPAFIDELIAIELEGILLNVY